MERETKTFKTPTGLSVVVRAFATAREIQAIEGKLFGSVKMGIEKGEPAMEGFTPLAQQGVEHEMIKLLVISIGEQKENLVDFALDSIKAEDYDAIIAELNEITKKKSTKKA